jgi:internalin A
MSDIIDRWLKSAKFAIIEGLALRPRESPFLKGTALVTSRGQANVYFLNNGTRWILKKFLEGRKPGTKYLEAIAKVLPKDHFGFESGIQRKLLRESSLSGDGYYSTEFSEWLCDAVLMPSVTGYDWAFWADKLRDDRLSLSQQQRLQLCKHLSEHIICLEENGISHRDLSSTDIMIDSQTWQVHLIDWDSLYHDSLDMPENTTFGTYGYLSPIIKESPHNSWCQYSDRFALAILNVEFLLMTKGYPLTGDGGMFEQKELNNRYGPGISKALNDLHKDFPEAASLFSTALDANSFEQCPSPQAWLRVVPGLAKPLPPIVSPVLSYDDLGYDPESQKVDLISRRLSEIPGEIFLLVGLRELFLQDNQLAELPGDIGNLKHLGRLHLNHNLLEKLPSEIGQLSDLRTLTLRGNRLTELPIEIKHLTKLTYLDLEDNPLPIPKMILARKEEPTAIIRCYLNYLSAKIDLSANQLEKVPAEVFQLSNIKELSLENNHLAELSSEIESLSHLHQLNLNHNRLQELPPEIGKLKSLEILNLRGNRLRKLPIEFRSLTQLTVLDLRDNPLPIPSEILARTGDPDAIIHYYFELLSKQTRPLNEAKVVLVGEAGVGKTSIVNRLVSNTFKPESMTPGIEITPWAIKVGKNTIRLNLWDFGGQEIMNTTHQFFLTQRTLYILVIDTHLSEDENRLGFWLETINSFGDTPSLIIVGNKVDQQVLTLDKKGIRKQYPNVKDIIPVSCVSGEGIDNLQRAIVQQIETLKHIHDEIPTMWHEIKAVLENKQEDYISYAEYKQLCKDNGVNDEKDQRTLLNFLHDLGVVLHFPDPRLESTNILNPQWVTQAVYQILNAPILFRSKGVLDWEILGSILDTSQYPKDKQLFILDMMCKFEIGYRFNEANQEKYLIPDLLTKEEPYLGEDSEWEDVLCFQYHYKALYNSLISRFIVRMHKYIHRETVWRNGTLLKLKDTSALIRADRLSNRITIQIRGPVHQRHVHLATIRTEFEHLHKSIPGLSVAEKVPIPGHPGIFEDYQHLLNMESLGEKTWIPSGLKERVSIRFVLDGIEPQSARLERQESSEKNEENVPSEQKDAENTKMKNEATKWNWFYLFATIVVLIVLAFIGFYVPWHVFTGVIIGAILILTIIGTLELKRRGDLDDASFGTVIGAALERLGLFNLSDALEKDQSSQKKKKSK